MDKEKINIQDLQCEGEMHLPIKEGLNPLLTTDIKQPNIVVAVICKKCDSINTKKLGFDNGKRRYYCNDCKKSSYYNTSNICYSLISLKCEECGYPIQNFNRWRSKKYCDECAEDVKREQFKKWEKKNPERRWELRYAKACKSNGGILKGGIDEYKKRYYREIVWKRKERKGINFEKRYLINNCIICGRIISMYPSNSKYCVHCSEKHLHELGTITFGSHIRRVYDNNKKEVVFDWKKEEKAVRNQLLKVGLKPAKG